MPSPELLTDALLVWTGKGDFAWPHRSDERLVERFGAEVAVDLIPAVRQLEQDFYESDAAHTEPNLVAVGDAAAARFRERHPEIGEPGVEALAWCYTFDWK